MKLNLSKCAFEVSSGKFLGFMVNQRGVEANPDKIQVVLEMTSSCLVKDVQRLTCCLVAFSRFISRATDRNLPFFKVLRNAKSFEWIEGCERMFTELKSYLTNLLLLSKPKPEEILFLYLAISSTAVRSTFFRKDGKAQLPVYYVNHALTLIETRYSDIENSHSSS